VRCSATRRHKRESADDDCQCTNASTSPSGRCFRFAHDVPPKAPYDARVTNTRMRHVQAVQADYDTRSPRWAHVYDGVSFHDVVLQQRLAIALGMLDRRHRVAAGLAIDVGCGAGQLLEALHAEGGPVAGVDVSWQQVTLSRERVPAAVFVAQADAGRLPFANESAATLTALGLLEYLPSFREGLAEFSRVTRRGGHVVVSAPNPLRLAYVFDPIGAVLGRMRRTRPGYRRSYRSARALAAELRACEFEVIEIRGHALGRFTFAGRPVLSDAKSVRLSELLQARLPDPVLRLLGANLVAIARRA